MNVIPYDTLPEIMFIEPDVYCDTRGEFFEMFQKEKYARYGITAEFVQDNVSFSKRGILRGLHYQLGRPQGKLVMVIHGEIFDVAVDIRKGSPTFGKWSGAILSSGNHIQVYIPEGFAHGFCVLSDTASVVYKCTDYYVTSEERGILWNDPILKIEWPLSELIVSERDRDFRGLKDIKDMDLPVYQS